MKINLLAQGEVKKFSNENLVNQRIRADIQLFQ